MRRQVAVAAVPCLPERLEVVLQSSAPSLLLRDTAAETQTAKCETESRFQGWRSLRVSLLEVRSQADHAQPDRPHPAAESAGRPEPVLARGDGGADHARGRRPTQLPRIPGMDLSIENEKMFTYCKSSHQHSKI